MFKKMMEQFGINTDEDLEIKERQETKPPPLFKVFLLNDDYTTMEFVINILENVFRKSSVDAAQIMLHVHKNGKGMAGIYTRGIAETKVQKYMSLPGWTNFPSNAPWRKND